MTPDRKTDAMNCLECGGACCEDVVLPASRDRATNDWLHARGEGVRGLDKKWVRFRIESRCPELTNLGECERYADRPLLCAEYKAGGPACLEALRERRTSEQIERIKA